MYIEQLDLENFRTFAQIANKPLFFVHPECDFRSPKTPPSPEDDRLPRPRLPNITLLLGDNGSGKTTILRAIAASAFGPAAKDLLRDSTLVRHGENTARIFAKLLLHQQDQAPGERIDSDIELHRRGERLDVQLGSPQFRTILGSCVRVGERRLFCGRLRGHASRRATGHLRFGSPHPIPSGSRLARAKPFRGSVLTNPSWKLAARTEVKGPGTLRPG